MTFPASSTYSLIPDDVDFSRRQLDAANFEIIRYNASGQPVYGYTDQQNVVRELGTLGSFNALDKSLYVNVNTISSSKDPLGLRTYDGVYNNLNPGRETWGSTDTAFVRLVNADYSNYLGQNINNAAFNPGRFGPGTQGFQDFFQTAANGQTNSNGIANSAALYADPFKTVVDYTPRMISQTITSQTALNRLGIGKYDSSSNLIRNGSFEDKQYSTQGWRNESSLNGWSSTTSIEVQNWNNSLGNATEGNNWIELDGERKNIRQDIQTEAGKSYTLSFSHGARPGVSLANTKVEVYWNGQLIDTLNENGVGQSRTQWKSYTYQVQGNGNGTSGLEFRSVGSTFNQGSFIDNVKLFNADEAYIPSSRSNDENNQSRNGGSGIFMLFGQYFDHGLDFIEKGGNIGANGQGARLVIPLSPSDPLYNPSKGVTSITVSRATVANPLSAGADGKFRTADDINPGADGKYGTNDDSVGPVNPTYLNRTSAYADLSQAYGSDQQIAELLREWVVDPNNSGKYIAGASLLSGYTLDKSYDFAQADGTSINTRQTVPTLRELRQHLAATGRDDLNWDDIRNYRARDSQGRVLDGDPNQAGIQAIRTNQAILLDSNPKIDASRIYQNGSTPDNSGPLAGVVLGSTLDVRGFPTTITVNGVQNNLSKYFNTNTFAIQPNLSVADQAIANELLLRSVGDHYVAGDGRLNENFGLTTMHHVFHQNHIYHLNTLQSVILKQQSDNSAQDPAHFWQVEVKAQDGVAPAIGVNVVNGRYEDAQGNLVKADGSISWNQDKLFEAARLINQNEYQHITVEYAKFVTPDMPTFSNYKDNLNAGVSLEYSQAAFRFGHSQVRETLDVLDPNGSLTASVQKFALNAAFLNPSGFAKNGPAGVALGMARQESGEIDEFVTPSLQQSLLAQPLDLAAINIIRGRDLGLPTLNETRKQLRSSLAADKASDSSLYSTLKVESLNPYTSWSDFRSNMIHPQSIVNFIAAYSFDGDVSKAEAIVGLVDGKITQGSAAARGYTLDQAKNFFSGGDQGFQKIDLWIGGLAEKHVSGGQLGSTFNVIFVNQMERLQDGDRFYYLHRVDSDFQEARGLFSEIEAENFKDVVERTTGARHLQGDVFEYNDNHIELGEVAKSDPKNEHKYGGLAAVTQQGLGVRSKDGTSTSSNGTVITENSQQYVLDVRLSTISNGYNSSEVIGGTNNNDFIDGGGGSNTIYGEGGNDRLIGGSNKDFIYGGIGNDFIHGGGDDDLLNGGVGNDTIYGGDGVDALVGEAGNDLLFGEAGDDEFYGGYGNDIAHLGTGDDRFFGGEGYDIAHVNDDVAKYKISSSNDSKWKFTVDGGDEKVLVDVERIEFSGTNGRFDALTGSARNDNLTATTNQSLLAGGDGDDTLNGGSNNDHFQGGRGNDLFVGTGTGIDTVYYDGSYSDYRLSVVGGNLQITDTVKSNGDDGSDTLIGIERVRFSSVNPNTGITTSEDYGFLNGTNGNDNLTATSTAQIVLGNDGNDNIFGSTGNDLLSGGNGNDVLLSGTGNDQLYGGDGNDYLDGQTGRNYLDGGAGTDVFVIASDHLADTVVGGESANDLDFADFQNWGGVNVGLNLVFSGNEAASGKFGNADFSFSEIEMVGGSKFDDVIDARITTSGMILNGNTGNDSLFGGSGNDLLNGDSGNDTLNGGVGNDTMIGGDGIDQVIYTGTVTDYQLTFDTAGNLLITDKVTTNGDDGTDQLTNIENLSFAGNNFVLLNGTPGDDTIVAPNSSAIIFGNAGNDGLTGGIFDDLLVGGLGSDTLRGGSGNDVAYYAGAIADYQFSNDTSGNVLVIDRNITNGDEGIDRLAEIEFLKFADAEARIVNGVIVRDNARIGGDGNDFLQGGVGNDTINGAAGNDTVVGNDGNDLVQGGIGADALYGGNDQDTLTGEDGNDFLQGGWGNDSLDGGSGQDTLEGDNGNDSLNGGSGNDVAIFSGTFADYQFTVNSAGSMVITDKNLGNGDDGQDVITNVEVLRFSDTDARIVNGIVTRNSPMVGTNAADFIQGDAGNDTLDGLAGNDTIVGGDGNDFILGGIGIDALYGGNDQDTLVGDDGNDFLHGGWGSDALYGGNNQDELVGDDGNDYLQGGWDNDTLYGGNDQDTLLGDEGIDILVGDNGNDFLQGGNGTDSLYGGNDQDILVGDDGNDFLQAGWGDDSLYGGNDQDILIGDDGNDFLQGGWGDDTLDGGNGQDTLIGDIGRDLLTGGNGNDLLLAGGGDTLVGGAGQDIFAGFATLSADNAQADVIRDFEVGSDKIALSRSVFGSLISQVGNGFNLTSEFAVVDNVAAVANSRALIIFNSADQTLTYNANGTAAGLGNGGIIAKLDGISTLSSSDFQITT